MAAEYTIAVSGDLKITNNGDGELSGNLEVVDSETYQASISKAGAPVSTVRHSFNRPVAN